MKLFKSLSGRICNNCGNRDEDRTLDLQYGNDIRSQNTICLCITCIDELEGMISQIGMFK